MEALQKYLKIAKFKLILYVILLATPTFGNPIVMGEVESEAILTAGVLGIILEAVFIYLFMRRITEADIKLLIFTAIMNILTLIPTVFIANFLLYLAEIFPIVIEYYLLRYYIARTYKKKDLGRTIFIAVLMANTLSFILGLLLMSNVSTPHQIEEPRKLLDYLNISTK